MRVLGVDPGLTRCGLGVVDGALGRPLQAVAVDVVRTSSSDDLGTRLRADRAASWSAGSTSTSPMQWRSSGSSPSTTSAP